MKATPHTRTVERENTTLIHLRRLASWSVFVQTGCVLFFTACLLAYPDSSDVAVGCGAVSILAACVPLVYTLYYSHVPVLFSAITAFTLAPIWFLFLETVLPGYDAFRLTPPHLRIEEFCWISTFVLVTNLFYLFLKTGVTAASNQVFSFLPRLPANRDLYFYTALFCFVVPIMLFVVYYGSPAVLWSAISGGRSGGGSAGGLLIQDSVGDNGNLMLPISWIWQVTPYFGTVAFLLSASKVSAKSLLALAVSLMTIFAFFLSGSRGIMMYVAAPMLFCFGYFNYRRGLAFWAVCLGMVLVLVGIMELQLRFRGNLLEVLADPAAAAKSKGYDSATTLDLTESHRDNNSYLLGLVLQGYPEKYPFEGFNDFLATAVNPIPRALWPGKPILTGAKELTYQPRFILDGPLFMGTTSLSYSVVGEAYQAKGVWGIVVYGFTFALFLLFVDSLHAYVGAHRKIVAGVLGMGVFLAFWGVRAFFAFVSFIYPFFLVIFILWVLTRWHTSHKSSLLS